MADELNPEQVQQELFELASAPPAAETPPEAPVEPVPASIPPSPPPPTPPAPEPQEAAIPSWRLREEAEARRLAETRASALEARLNEINAHLRQAQQKPDFFKDPDAATQAVVAQTLLPFVEEQRRVAEENRRIAMYNGKMVAESVHGADKVAAAEQAFLNARAAQTLDPADYERVVQSPNRYDAAVQWHKRQTVFASVGEDPAAWFEQQLETRMADPKFQAQLLEKVRANAATRPAVTKLPPSLSKATAAASNADGSAGDMSDASLFAYAMRK
jgi:hypothetical protein